VMKKASAAASDLMFRGSKRQPFPFGSNAISPA
jgi:hypothetical protein